jgi:hypothetical protein
MIDIIIEGGYVTFTTSVSGVVASNVESCETVDEYSYHLGTSIGVYLININDSTINGIKFTNSTKAFNYITNN